MLMFAGKRRRASKTFLASTLCSDTARGTKDLEIRLIKGGRDLVVCRCLPPAWAPTTQSTNARRVFVGFSPKILTWTCRGDAI